MQIRCVVLADIPKWQSLSSEYDRYVKELVPDLTEWYEGNDDSLSFTTYMKSKIVKQEAFMAVDASDMCLGIVAFSKKNNCITFFAVSHNADFDLVGHALLRHALGSLNASTPISINACTSREEWIENHRKLFVSLGFTLYGDAFENGVPVNTYIKTRSQLSAFPITKML